MMLRLRYLYAFLLLVGGSSLLFAQYQPTVIEGANWVQIDTRASGIENYGFTHHLEGDTLVGEIVYKKLYRRWLYFDWNDYFLWTPVAPYNVSKDKTLVGLLRENIEEERLYGRYVKRGEWTSDTLLHDFSLTVGDTLIGARFAPEEVGLQQIIEATGQREVFGAVRNFQTAAREYAQGVVSLNYGPFSGGVSAFTNDGRTFVIDHCVGEYGDCNVRVIDPATTPYQPMAIDSANWVIFDAGRDDNGERKHRIMSIQGDSIVEGVTYKKLFRRTYLPDDPSNFWNAAPPYPVGEGALYALLRDDTLAQTVYGRFVEATLANEYPGELVIHDFSGNTGDTINTPMWCEGEDVERVEWIDLYGKTRKWQFIDLEEAFVSGIGKIRGGGGIFSANNRCGIGGGTIIDYCVGPDADCNIGRPNSLEDFSPEHRLTLHPNPVPATLSVQLSSPLPSEVAVTLYDLNGRALRRAEFQDNLSWELADLPSGVYVAVFTHEGARVVRKVVKE